MKTITKYLANDGSEWGTVDEALEREALCARIAAATEPLGPRRDISENEFIQHDPTIVVACRVKILAICAEQFPSFAIFRHEPPEEVHPLSVAGRILDDLGGPLREAWSRFARIDEQGREWQQVYYVTHPPANATRIK